MRLDKFDLNLLVALDALLRSKSVTAAAVELHVTQSAMSSALKRLRAHFEDEILYFDGQEMVPTSFGRTIEAKVPDMISQLRNLSRMRANRELFDLDRQFTVIASDYASVVFVSALSKHLSTVAPKVSLRILPFIHETYEQFQRGVGDFLIAPNFGIEGNLDFCPLFTDSFSCVLCRNNPLVAEGLTEEAFFTSPHIVTQFFREEGNSHLKRWMDDRRVSINVAVSLSSFVVLPHYVAGTKNIATIHNRLIPQFDGNPELVFIPPPVDVPPLQEHLVTSRKHKHDAEAQMIADEILKVGAQLENE